MDVKAALAWLKRHWPAAVALLVALALLLLLRPSGHIGSVSRATPSTPQALATQSPSPLVSPSPGLSPSPAVSASNRAAGGHGGGPSSPAAPRSSPASGTYLTPTGFGFAYGPLQSGSVGSSGCGSNSDGEPAIHVSRAGALFIGSELGLGGGSDGWVQAAPTGGPGASACSPTYVGQPNSVPGTSGGDIDLAWGSDQLPAGSYPLYVASLNGGSVTVSTSSDGGHSFRSSYAQTGLPGDDREWIAAYGANLSLLSFHDANGDIEVLRSTSFGGAYSHAGFAALSTTTNNEIGNIVFDHGTGRAYQSYVAGGNFDTAYVAASSDPFSSWTPNPVTCSNQSGQTLDHQFPNISVAPSHALWMTWSDDSDVFTAVSTDGGNGWSCARVSTNTIRAVMPWIVAGSSGVDLVYYGTSDATNWYVYFVQNLSSSPQGWGPPAQLMAVHRGPVCELGVACATPTGNRNRQLYDDFGIDVDPQGYAHIAYSHDSPDIGGQHTFTGYAVQTSGPRIGSPN